MAVLVITSPYRLDNLLVSWLHGIKKKRDNYIAALVLRCNCMFALVFLTLHVCPWFSKLKAPFAPVCQHRELDLNNCSKKTSQKRKKRGKDYTTPYPKHITPSTDLRLARLGVQPPHLAHLWEKSTFIWICRNYNSCKMTDSDS